MIEPMKHTCTVYPYSIARYMYITSSDTESKAKFGWWNIKSPLQIQYFFTFTFLISIPFDVKNKQHT